MRRLCSWIFAFTAVASPAGAEILDLEIDGAEARATIELPGGVAADVVLGFEQVLGLSAEGLGLTADLVSTTDLLGRLPSGASLPSAFPLRLSVAPPAGGPLTFTGVTTLELHTHNLSFTASTPLRLFRAPAGGAFVDVTETMGMGSYRVRGSSGGFSEFLVLADTRPVATVVSGKFDRLQALLDANADGLPAALADELDEYLNSSRSAATAGLPLAAIDELDAFVERVRAESGKDIPNLWRSSRDLLNLAGELRAAAATLRFSLNLQASAPTL
jgi:hypothetical protein